MSRTAIVTGGSSGIGLAVCEALKNAGCAVYELSRREASREGITHISCDVTDAAAVRSAVESVARQAGRLDILVTCAGFGISGAVEFTDPGDARRQLDVNLFGTANAVQAALPFMREGGGGRIVCVSSVAACVPIPFQTWYSVSKAAINAYVMALGNEVRRFGISVCAVMPGDTRTGFTDARKKEAAGDEVYGGVISRSVEKMERDERGGAPAEAVGAYIASRALKKRVKPLYAAGFAYKLAVVAAGLMPCALRARVIGLLYA